MELEEHEYVIEVEVENVTHVVRFTTFTQHGGLLREKLREALIMSGLVNEESDGLESQIRASLRALGVEV